MSEVLTRAEMEARFDGEWVLVADPEMDENREVLRGRVISHGQDPEAVHQEVIDHQVRHWAALSFVPMPERIWLNPGLFY